MKPDWRRAEKGVIWFPRERRRPARENVGSEQKEGSNDNDAHPVKLAPRHDRNNEVKTLAGH